MLTIFLNVLLGLILGGALWYAGLAAPGWAVFWGVLALAGGQVGVGLLLRKKMKTVTDEVQAIMATGQKRMQQKLNVWQRKPPASMKQAQAEMENDQRAIVAEALRSVEKLVPYCKWIPLLRRQADTMRLQFHWQLKAFDQVDALMPRALMLDPMMMAMKLARMHMRQDPKLDATFAKLSKRVRYGQGELLYALYAWILMQRKDVDGALRILVEAGDKMQSETLKRNREALANNRVNHFTLSGLGDAWYALHLETPKVKAQRMSPHQAGRFF